MTLLLLLVPQTDEQVVDPPALDVEGGGAGGRVTFKRRDNNDPLLQSKPAPKPTPKTINNVDLGITARVIIPNETRASARLLVSLKHQIEARTKIPQEGSSIISRVIAKSEIRTKARLGLPVKEIRTEARIIAEPHIHIEGYVNWKVPRLMKALYAYLAVTIVPIDKGDSD